MLTPALLALHNAAVLQLPKDRAVVQKEANDRIASHFGAVEAQSNRLINALEAGDVPAILAVLDDVEFQHSDTFQNLGLAVYRALKPVLVIPVAPAVAAHIEEYRAFVNADLPPIEPPAEVPEPAAAEPTPEPEPIPVPKPTKPEKSSSGKRR